MLMASPLFEQPSGGGEATLDVLTLPSWSTSKISAWVEKNVEHGQEYSPIFTSHNVNGQAIFDMDDDALREMGIAHIGKRKVIGSTVDDASCFKLS